MSEQFTFNDVNLKLADGFIAKYPKGREKSAIIALLELAQRQNDGWLSRQCIEYIADMIKMPYIRVYEVASFYTMFNLEPVGKYHIQVCGTTPCWLSGAYNIKAVCERALGLKESAKHTKDYLFTLSEVECLGACVNAPVVQINDDYYENLSEEKMLNIITELQKKQK